ncbi:glycosyltransferase involved in cell wall biosynthesis [Microbacterium proteolyticum]|uniref:Glycosyltransferase involved in cell wall biosynthesis n=1 Tax=Microbacterium proteolyticum TaxID=1572644 RepID=A0A7W5CJ31_9MICO|nr:glycosyltransferase involved in cell wall biosynthesis [Microbacterium proteolyticum]
MKIAHVVTFTSADGAFGGPTRVALGQAKALVGLGHDVTVFAGTPAGEETDIQQDGYRLRTFPVRRLAPFGGFATLWPRGLRAALRSQAHEFDVAHIHLARDLATLPAALLFGRLGVPYVTQSHGMIDRSDKMLAAVLDRLATRRALAGSRSWLLLTAAEEKDLAGISEPQRLTSIRNGIESRDVTSLDERTDTVLFLARLHKRKRPVAFVQMAQLLAARLPHTSFVLVGPDEGEAETVTRAIAEAGLGDRIRWIGALPPTQTFAAMSDARVYVLPAVDEVFPMSILESFSAGTPVVTTSSLGIAADCERHGAALITDGSPDELAEATYRAHQNRETAEALRGGGLAYIRSELDVQDVARELVSEYRAATGLVA